MILGENIDSVYSAGKEIQRVYSLGKLVWEKKTQDDDIDYNTIPFTVQAVDESTKITLDAYDSNSLQDNVSDFKYSINGGQWIETTTKTSITLNKNDKVQIIASNLDGCNIIGLSDIYGNIMSLRYGDDFVGQTVWKPYGALDKRGFFSECDIRNAKNLILPATTFVDDGYAYMFYGCTSLTTAPELPATTLDETSECYAYMFYGCTSLTTAPELPATTLGGACYIHMFNGCTSLTTAPELPATTLKTMCYANMFKNCSNLNYIKCYARYKSMGSINFFDFAIGASPRGKLVCYEESADIFRNYIPDTWTVEYITE